VSKRICLIVDDEPAIRGLLRAILTQQFRECLEAENAIKALQIVNKLGGRVDLVISDIEMPGEVNGIDLAHFVHNTFPAIPVILISGYLDWSRKAPEFEFVPKPFVQETILNAVEKVVAK
jgi:YesN/AraC family two-component response regulator